MFLTFVIGNFGALGHISSRISIDCVCVCVCLCGGGFGVSWLAILVGLVAVGCVGMGGSGSFIGVPGVSVTYLL